MLMLVCVKKLWLLAKDVKQGGWDFNIAKPIRRLNGQILGLCGLGRIPRQVAFKAQALGMDVISYDPYMSAEAMAELKVRKVDFETLCRESDVISITLPLNDETKYLFDERAFEMMKDSAYIINTARGAVIKESALVDALKKKQIAGAGLDVLENETPNPDNPLFQMDNVIVTPHCAFLSVGSEDSLLSQCGEQTAAVYRTGAPTHSVNQLQK